MRKLAETDSILAKNNILSINPSAKKQDYKQIMEGIVIKPIIERTDPKIGRVLLKLVSNRYYQKGESEIEPEEEI